MKIRNRQTDANNVVIQTPCSVGWDNMDGDDKIRFCSQCQLNVHNISTLPPKEVDEVLSKARTKERICVFMYKRADGTVVLDNCPVVLRKTRDRIRAAYVAALLVILWLIGSNADAQGLVGAPTNPHFGISGQLNDPALYNAECHAKATDISDRLAFLSGIAATIIPFILSKRSKLTINPWFWLALAVVPFTIFIVGRLIWK